MIGIQKASLHQIEAELRRQHALAHGSACECRCFELHRVLAEHDTALTQPSSDNKSGEG